MQKLVEPMMRFRNAEAPAASRGFHVETRSPISWLQHDSLEELKECADPMLTPAPLGHTQQCSCSKGLFNIQITTASAICRALKFRRVFIAQIWILQKHRRDLSTPISASVNFIFAASAAGTDIVEKEKKNTQKFYVVHKISSQKNLDAAQNFYIWGCKLSDSWGSLKKNSFTIWHMGQLNLKLPSGRVV